MDIDSLNKFVSVEINKIFQKFKNPQNLIILFIGIGFLLVLGIILFRWLSPEKVSTIGEDQIKIQKGEKIVIVDKNGLVEYRTSEGVFYEVWDSARISDFFALMETRAREYLENPNTNACNTGYSVTLYVDGVEVVVCFEEDPLLDEIYQEFGGGSQDDSISDIFDDLFADEGAQGTPGPGTPTPIPTPLIVSAEEGTSSGGGGGSQPLVACDIAEQDVSSRTVISNILCAPDAPSPTATPNP